MNKFIGLIREVISIYSSCRLSQASAALAYYLTMTFFPMLIVVCAILGGSDKLLQLLEFGEKLLNESVMQFVREFLLYVENSDSRLMLSLGLAVLISYASAAFRSVQGTVGLIQGGVEHTGIKAYIFSFVYTAALIAVMYLSVIIMMAGKLALDYISEYSFPLSLLHDCLHGRYLLMSALLFVLLLGLYYAPKRREDKYSVLPGAFFSSLAIFVISPLFSEFMGRSVKYSLVYGSIASLILLMLWIYMCCMLVYIGAAMNLAFYKSNMKKSQNH